MSTYKKKFKRVAKELLNSELKKEISKYIENDTDFQNVYRGTNYNKFCKDFAETVVNNLETYILDKTYIDISYLICKVGIINLDDVYELFKDIQEVI